MKLLLALPAFALLASCQAIPPAPPLKSYHALGTEPFWSLSIGGAQMQFDEPNGPTRIVVATPRVIVGVAGEIYRTGRLDVNIVHARCSDGMSDRVYPDKVQVTAEGKSYTGCGGL